MKHLHVFPILCAMLFHVFALANTGIDPGRSGDLQNKDYSCPAPAPTGLHETDVTPTSISLAWNPVFSPYAVYFQVEGYDLTSSSALPTYVTTNTYITYTGLTAGHSYQFQVSASYCSNGPFGPQSAPKGVSIPTIVIDNIVELQSPCTPGNARATYNGASFTFCVQQSTTSEPYTNGVVGSIGNYQFAVAYYNGEIAIGDLNTNNTAYYFGAVNASEVICYQEAGSTDIALFSIKHNNGTVALPRLNIRFFANCGNFSSCGSPCEMVEDRSNDNFAVGAMPDPGLTGMVVPNPFAGTAVFRYQLEEDAPVEIGLYDAPGRLLQTLESAPMLQKGQHETLITATGLPAGIYFLHTKIGPRQKSFMIIKTE
jgi:hypothetical protein